MGDFNGRVLLGRLSVYSLGHFLALSYSFMVLRQKSLMFFHERVCKVKEQAASMSLLPGTFLDWKKVCSPRVTSCLSSVVQRRRLTRLRGRTAVLRGPLKRNHTRQIKHSEMALHNLSFSGGGGDVQERTGENKSFFNVLHNDECFASE